jgi:HK97 family phage major capsid protein
VKLAELLTQIEEKARQVKTLWDDADAEGKDADRDSVVKLNQELEELEKKALDLKQDAEWRIANDRRLDDLRRPTGHLPMPGANGKNGKSALGPATAKSLGAHFVESETWQAYVKAAAPGGRFPDGQHVQSPPLRAADYLTLKTLITGLAPTSGGAFVVPDQSGIFDPLGRRPVTLRSIVSVRQTTSDAVEYVRQVSRANAAAPVAEATATTGTSGTKPEGGFTFERVQELVRTIAEWVAATKRALSDAAQLRGIIDDELRADLVEAVDWQILNGDGTGENFTGLLHVDGTQEQLWDTNILTTTRKGRTKVLTPGRSVPSAYVLNPLDWETIDLLQDNEARYYFGGPSVIGTPRLWGLPVVETEAQTQGTGWVGEWRRIVLWDREEANVSVSDSHADFYIRNLVAILAELRATMGCIRPSAFVKLDLTAA